MMNETIKYEQLLNIRCALQSNLSHNKYNWTQTFKKYGKETVLYDIGHDKVKELRQAIKDLDQVTNLLRSKRLYEHCK
jgi:hypothetical protein